MDKKDNQHTAWVTTTVLEFTAATLEISSSVRPGRAKVVRSIPSVSHSSFKPTTAMTASASLAMSTACSSNLSEPSESWISAPPRRSTPVVLKTFLLLLAKKKKFRKKNVCTHSGQILPRHQLDLEHCKIQHEFHVWCSLSTGMCLSFPKLDRRMRVRVVDGTNYRSPTDHLRRAIQKWKLVVRGYTHIYIWIFIYIPLLSQQLPIRIRICSHKVEVSGNLVISSSSALWSLEVSIRRWTTEFHQWIAFPKLHREV